MRETEQTLNDAESERDNAVSSDSHVFLSAFNESESKQTSNRTFTDFFDLVNRSGNLDSQLISQIGQDSIQSNFSQNIGLIQFASLQDGRFPDQINKAPFGLQTNTTWPLPGFELNLPGAKEPAPYIPDIRTEPGKQRDRGFEQIRPGAENERREVLVRELRNLDGGAGVKGFADAVVVVPKDLDRTQPIRVEIYAHGQRSTASSAIRESNLAQQMEHAPFNTVLIVPEWQSSPGTSNNNTFMKGNGRFDRLVQSAFEQTPELNGLTLKEISSVGLIAHSAGYVPSKAILYNNLLGEKVKSITYLDALYSPLDLDPWFRANAQALASGEKRFVNIYNDTASGSVSQLNRLKSMFNKAGISDSVIYANTRFDQAVISPETLAKYPIVFKASSASAARKEAHASLPDLYLSRVQRAANYNTGTVIR